MDREKLYQVYHTILSIVLTWALTLGVNEYFELKVTVFLCAFFSMIPATCIYLFDINRKNSLSYVILFSILPITAFILWIKKVNPVTYLQNLLEWCRIYNGSEETYQSSYPKFLIFSLSIVASAILFLLMKRLLAKVILAVLLLVGLIILSYYEVNLGKLVIGICLFYILTILVEICGIQYSRKVRRQDKREEILYLIPVCMLLALLSVMMPSKEEPMQWKTVKKIYHGVKDQLDQWRLDLEYYFSQTGAEFSLQFTGYDEDSGELGRGGSLNRDDRITLRASGHRTSKPVYLIGSVSDVYTGYSWEKSKLDYTPDYEDYYLDYCELMYALARQDLNLLEEEQFIERKAMTIEFINIKTKTCFYPIKSSWFDMSNKSIAPDSLYSSLLYKKAQSKGNKYQTVFYDMNLKGEAFQQMLREADDFVYEGEVDTESETFHWLRTELQVRTNANSYRDGWVPYSALDQRARMIQQQYTKLPEELPDRVRELAYDITEGYDTNYDKLKAIESFLTTYSYTLSPGNIPEDADFVDYFLFDNQEGYCTAFASAMAVLARCVGIPTRYVEGFILTYEGEPVNGMYPIKSSQAHAWAEAYIKGVGWIPFEATASYYDTRYITWKKKVTSSEANAITPPPNPHDYKVDDFKPNIQDQKSIKEEEIEKKTNLIHGIIISITTVIIIILMLLLYYYFNKMKYHKAFTRGTYGTKMYMLFLRILRMIRLEGYYIYPQETILMLANRVKNQIYEDNITFQRVAEIFMKYRYAEAEITKEEYEAVARFHELMLERQRQERGRLQLFLEEFIFLSKKQNRLA